MIVNPYLRPINVIAVLLTTTTFTSIDSEPKCCWPVLLVIDCGAQRRRMAPFFVLQFL